MNKTILTLFKAGLLLLVAINATSHAANPRVNIQTNYGNIVVELYPDKAPATVANFLNYVDSGFYSSTIFHRVIKGFMIQGGGFNEDYQQKPTQAPVKNEANNGLSNTRSTIAMARTSVPDSATAQFFINTVDNSRLDFRYAAGSGWGYCVFGKVVEGMQVADEIESVPTGPAGPFNRDAPQGLVVIEKITRIENKTKPVKENKQ
jgi:peptidyl-prolyl cis-trans isomerase A (cyclophilin A)/peptidyl-prolyl cis-trans isomerase B (cyclophilin B)